MKKQIILVGNTAKNSPWIPISETTNLLSIHIYSQKGGVGKPELGDFNGQFSIEQSHCANDIIDGSETFNYAGTKAKLFQTGIKAPFLRVKCLNWNATPDNYYYVSLIEYE